MKKLDDDTRKLLRMFIFGIILGVILTLIIQCVNVYIKSEAVIGQFDTKITNLTGVYLPSASFVVSLDRNSEDILNTISHEYIHHLIIQNKTCGNETCWEHFCGGYNE